MAGNGYCPRCLASLRNNRCPLGHPVRGHHSEPVRRKVKKPKGKIQKRASLSLVATMKKFLAPPFLTVGDTFRDTRVPNRIYIVVDLVGDIIWVLEKWNDIIQHARPNDRGIQYSHYGHKDNWSRFLKDVGFRTGGGNDRPSTAS